MDVCAAGCAGYSSRIAAFVKNLFPGGPSLLVLDCLNILLIVYMSLSSSSNIRVGIATVDYQAKKQCRTGSNNLSNPPEE